MSSGSTTPEFELVARYGDKPLLFLFTGEGAHSAATDVTSLQSSSAWPLVEAALERHALPKLAALLPSSLGSHGAPLSPLVTTVINLLNAARWVDEGFIPTFVVGHSIGEVAAAHVAGLLTLDEAVGLAHGLGVVGAKLSGAMLHTRISPRELRYITASAERSFEQGISRPWEDEPICIAAINSTSSASSAASGAAADEVGVTLSGPVERISAWLESDPNAKRLPPLHPWHHPAYSHQRAVETQVRMLPGVHSTPRDAVGSVTFVSSTNACMETLLDHTYWLKWLSSPGMRRMRLLFITDCLIRRGFSPSLAF